MQLDMIRLWRTAMRLWRVPLIAALIGALVFGGGGLLLPKSYVATTQMLITSQISGSSILADPSQISTFRELATSGPVLDRIIRELELDLNRKQLKSRIQIYALADTRIIEIRVKTNSPEESARIANAVARNFIKSASDLSVGEVQRNVDNLHGEAASQRDFIASYDARLVLLDVPENKDDTEVQSQIQEINRQKRLASQTLADIEASIRSLTTELQTMSLPITVTDFAQPPTKSASISPVLLAVLGCFLGALAGAALIVVMAFTDMRLRSVDEIDGVILARFAGKQPVAEQTSIVEMLAARIAMGTDEGNIALVSARETSATADIAQQLTSIGAGSFGVADGILDNANAVKVAAAANCAVLVVRKNESTLPDFHEVTAMLAAAETPVLGIVVLM